MISELNDTQVGMDHFLHEVPAFVLYTSGCFTRSPAPGRSNASSGKFVTENDLGWFRMLRRLHYAPDIFFL